jgi:hypothetical protein
MPTVSRTNNPTKVKSVGKNIISIRIAKIPGTDITRTFFIEHFDQKQLDLPFSTKVACIAAAGQTTQYFELGTIENLDIKSHTLTELAADASIQFRVIFYEANSSKILAASDNIRAVDDDTESPSLVSIQPVPLDGPLWKLELADSSSDSTPVLLVEEKLFSSAKAAAANPTFVSFVLPEVVRTIARRIKEENTDENDDSSSWLNSWVHFFKSINTGSIDPTSSDTDDYEKWIDDCVKAFCHRGQMALSIDAVLKETEGTNW